MLNILISGSNGYIATNFTNKFASKYNFIYLSHRKIHNHITLDELHCNKSLAESVDVVLNLAGANIADKRWSVARKKEILDSRVVATSCLVTIFNKLDKKPLFLSASAIGIYSEHVMQDEASPINYTSYDNFSQEITKKWELEAKKYLGNTAILRFGVVFGSNGGAFPKMLNPFLFYAGAILGTGQQFMPWIALVDLLNAINNLIETKSTGIYNLVSPDIISNVALSTCISEVWGKPLWFRMPKFIINKLFGQMGNELFLSSIKVLPTKLLDNNFKFKYPDIKSTLEAIKNKEF